jgi:ribonucleoside-triphosphate reductase
VDHNCSITVSYDKEEIRDIIEWLLLNWDSYVGVSFIYRNDPTKTAADLGYPYLPQEVVSKEVFDIYVAGLKPVNLDASVVDDMEDADCATGACPIR